MPAECGVAPAAAAAGGRTVDDYGLLALPVEPPRSWPVRGVPGCMVGAAGGYVTVAVGGAAGGAGELTLTVEQANALAVAINRSVYTAMSQTVYVEVNRRLGAEPASDSRDARGGNP